MSSDWVTSERDRIRTNKLYHRRTGIDEGPSAFQEFCISLLVDIIQSSPKPFEAVTEDLAQRLLDSGEEAPKYAWYDFVEMIFSAALWTSSNSTHVNLVGLVFALANYDPNKTTATPSHDSAGSLSSEVAGLLTNLDRFSLSAREYWNGPMMLVETLGSPETARRAWVNLNRFFAHLSRQQRRTPVEPLYAWVDKYGLWTMRDGLEYRAHARVEENGEAAAMWLLIAGSDIYSDPAWCYCDDSLGPGIHGCQGPLWDNRLAAGAVPEERWDLWKERLLEMAEDDSLDESTRETAKQAAQAMGEIESSTQI